MFATRPTALRCCCRPASRLAESGVPGIRLSLTAEIPTENRFPGAGRLLVHRSRAPARRATTTAPRLGGPILLIGCHRSPVRSRRNPIPGRVRLGRRQSSGRPDQPAEVAIKHNRETARTSPDCFSMQLNNSRSDFRINLPVFSKRSMISAI